MISTTQERESRLRPWEYVLLGLFAVVFAVSFYFYVTDFPVIRRYFFGLQEAQSTRPAGTLKRSSGKVRRQKASQAEFQQVSTGDSLFHLDTLVTGPDVEAEIQLVDGGEILLAPNTMVKLTFDSQISLAGISRRTNLELIQGSLSGSAKNPNVVIKTSTGKSTTLSGLGKQRIEEKLVQPAKPAIIPPVALISPAPPVPVVAPAPPAAIALAPSPSPSPSVAPPPPQLTAVPLLPAKGSSLSIASLAPGISKPELTLSLRWRTNLPSAKVWTKLLRIDRGTLRTPVFQSHVDALNGSASVRVKLGQPGAYQWILYENETRRQLASSDFKVLPEIDGLELFKPLISGTELENNQFNGRLLKTFGGITLRWKPIAGTTQYKVQIYPANDPTQPLLERSLSETQYTFNREKVVLGRFDYRVLALLPNGFYVRSPLDTFGFEFLPPKLVEPLDEFIIQRTQEGRLLMTWQKTHFTQSYELEISEDPGFDKIWLKKRVRENFQVIPLPQPGTYHWRVKAISRGATSAPSPSRTFIIR
jgi:hypothetical protein